MDRRTLIAAAIATAITPLPEEAPQHLTVRVLRGDTWITEPNGLRGVYKGERFRTFTPSTNLLVLDATADEDGHNGVGTR